MERTAQETEYTANAENYSDHQVVLDIFNGDDIAAQLNFTDAYLSGVVTDPECELAALTLFDRYAPQLHSDQDDEIKEVIVRQARELQGYVSKLNETEEIPFMRDYRADVAQSVSGYGTTRKPTPWDANWKYGFYGTTDKPQSLFEAVSQSNTMDAYLALNWVGYGYTKDIDVRGIAGFVKTLSACNKEQYQHMRSAFMKLPESMMSPYHPYMSAGCEFVQSFSAVEQGDDYGDTLQTILNHSERAEAIRVCGLINKYKHHSSKFAQWFAGNDPALTLAAERAQNERLTEVLALAADVAENGPRTINVGPNASQDKKFDEKFSSTQDILDRMELHERSMGLGVAIISDPDVKIAPTIKPGQGFQIWRFTSKYGTALLHTRREGTGRYDSSMEYGNAGGAEATISLTVNPIDPHNNFPKHPDSVSIFRLDREGRGINEQPGSEARSPVREDGIVSADISSILGDPNSPSARIGRTFAAANILRSAQHDLPASLHHNTNYFDQDKWGSAEGFSKVVDYVDAAVTVLMKQQNNKAHGNAALRAVYAKAA